MKLLSWVEDVNINYITYHTNTRKVRNYSTLDVDKYRDNHKNPICDRDDILIFDRERYNEILEDITSINGAILNSSFSCSQIVKDTLLNFIGKHHSIHFILDKEDILKSIQKHMSGNDVKEQSLKYYNNILKRLTFGCMELFEKTDKERENIFAQSITQRDLKIRNVKERLNMKKGSISTTIEVPDISL
ncbi:MAG: hypothetical protein Q8N78_03065 [Sulfurimonas sp.]|nr:hypothetical protein [Sulfurimonas sp.]